MLLAGASLSASAFAVAYYADHSALASGKWVKIRVTEKGVQQLTATQLKAAGFDNPEAVRVYGYGGAQLSELASTTNWPADDLKQTYSVYSDGVLYFWGIPANFTSLKRHNTYGNYYDFQSNTYSSSGYYFLSDNLMDRKEITKQTATPSDNGSDVQYAYTNQYWYEFNFNPGRYGQIFLGKNITSDGNARYEHQWNVRQAMPGSDAFILSSFAHKSDYKSGFADSIASVKGTTVFGEYLSASSAESYSYSINTHMGKATLPSDIADPLSTISTISKIGDKNATLQTINHQVLTYKEFCDISNLSGVSQRIYDFQTPKYNDRIRVVTDSKNLRCWNIEKYPNSIIEYTGITYTTNSDGKFTAYLTPKLTENSQLVFFNADQTQYTPEIIGTVPNQDLHGSETPNMLIITTPALHEQAERLAQYHRDADSWTVLVVDQEKVFNEFSSGTPDATAIRRFVKMFNDRERASVDKFRSVLLFGRGSYDNRNLTKLNDPATQLIMYENDNENSISANCSDDYFVTVSDYSNSFNTLNPSAIGVGRIPVISVQEATDVVDKLLAYYNRTDKTALWRARTALISDYEDSSCSISFSTSAETACDSFYNAQTASVKNAIGIKPVKLYCDNYTRNANAYAESAKQVMKKYLSDGVSSVYFVGHAAAYALTKTAKLWTTQDAGQVKYSRLPFFAVAGCDVAALDHDSRGLAERMFLTKDGGSIASFGASRTVYDKQNNILVRALFKYLYTLNSVDSKPYTIGEAAVRAKGSSNYCINNHAYMLIGDPAMRLPVPQDLAKVLTVNSTDLASASIYPGQEVTVTGTICDADGNVDTAYNGEVTVGLYEAQIDLGKNARGDREHVYTQNDILSETSSTVTAGKFSVTFIVPREVSQQNANASLQVVAMDDGNSKFVVSSADIYMNGNDETKYKKDTTAPVISSMYLNNTNFCEGDLISSGSTIKLYADFSDDTALSTHSNAVASVGVTLDDTYTINLDDISISADAKTGHLSAVVDNLSAGRHTLRLIVGDKAGNTTTRTLAFFYDRYDAICSLSVEPSMSSDETVISINADNFISGRLFVSNDAGDILFSTDLSEAVYKWDYCGNDGERLKCGAYNVYAQICTANATASTSKSKVVVPKQ